MKFTVSATALSGALAIVSRALSSKPSSPILDGVLIEAEDGALRLTCADDMLTITTSVSATIVEPGRGVAPGKLFGEFVKKSDGGMLNVTTAGTQFKLACAGSRMALAGRDADLFPAFAPIADIGQIAFPESVLRDMLAKALPAVAANDMREVLTGCYIETGGYTTNVVGLDGYRLNRATCQTGGADKASVLIPGRLAAELAHMLDPKSDAICTLNFDKQRVHVAVGGADIYSPLVAGEYVDYRKIMPVEFATRVVVNVESLRRATDRASVIAKDGGGNLLKFTVADGTLTISSNAEIGDVHEEVEAVQTGGDLTISFNVKYIIDALRLIQGETAEMAFASDIKPCIITSTDEPGFLALILPVRTKA